VTTGVVAECIIEQLVRHAGAMFVTELASATSSREDELARVLSELEEAGKVLLVDHPAPDRHLVGVDLRVVGIVTEVGEQRARERADGVWHAWLRAFLATHRCQ
jgi:hypothetical protein